MTMRLSCPAGAPCAYVTEEVELQTAMALLAMHKEIAHPATAPAQRQNSCKPEKFPRPSINVDTTDEAWQDFYTAWLQYKDEYNLTGLAITRQLYACCSTELATSLSRTTGGAHFTLSESQLLEQMKGLAVRYQNPAVHVQEFLCMSQQCDEGIRHYLSRLKGVAARCEFNVTCTCGVTNSFSESITRFKLIAGLDDKDIKEDILSMQTKDLEETVKCIENKESGKVARKKVGVEAKVSVVRTEEDTNTPSPKGGRRCKNCNRSGHGSHPKDREKFCPAWGKLCDGCGKEGHYKVCCNSGGKAGKRQSTSNEVAAEGVENNLVGVDSLSFGALAGVMLTMASVNKAMVESEKVKVPHMLYEQLRWVKKSPPRHPTCTLSVTVSVKGYQDNNFTPPPATRRRDTNMTALTDSGCQACCMGVTQLHALGLSGRDLLQPILSLKAANTSGITIIGVVFLMITGWDRKGNKWRTHQLCYVSEDVEQLLLSREACEQLGMLSKNFPEVGEFQNNATVTEVAAEYIDPPDMILPGEDMDLTPCTPSSEGTCTCPRRESPPPPPTFQAGKSASQLKHLILQHYASSAFNKCTRQVLPMMKGEPLPIHIKVGAKPYAAHTPIQVPVHWVEQVKSDLDRDVALGVIEEVPLNSPRTWCSRMVVVPKQSGEPRRTVDLQQLNKASVRQTHPNRSPFMLASDVPAGTKKSVLDVWNSFHSVPVVEEDRDKLCFVTQWGCYRYRVAPQGYLASGDGYCHRFSEITKSIENKRTIVDDTVLWSEDLEQNFNEVCNLLEVCSGAGLIFNPDKFQFGLDTVSFAGLDITPDGVRPSSKLLESIRAFPPPSNISEARSFFGMTNQVSYAFAMSPVMEPFRHLLKPDSPFVWSKILQEKFELAKEEIVAKVTEGIKHFETGRQTCLATDFSKTGVGFFLLQKWCDCKQINPRCCKEGWKVCLAGGRFTTPAESRYSPTEGECLAVAVALHKARHFVLGCPNLTVAVDHLPLLGLLNDRELADIHNPRLLCLKEKTLWFRYTMTHVPGGMHCGPDYMSRQGQDTTQQLTLKEARVYCINGLLKGEGDISSTRLQEDRINGVEEGLLSATVAALFYEDIRAVTFSRIREAIVTDEELSGLVNAIRNTPFDVEYPADLQQYQRYRDSLSVQDGVPMYGRRVIVPASLRGEVLAGLHAAHQGVHKMHDRSMQAVFWLGMFKDLEVARNSCAYCNKSSPSQAALPPHVLISPDFPFQMVVMDYCSIKGKTWLICADRFTGWVSTYYYPREATATDLVKTIKEYFTTFGVAEHISSDSGSQFVSQQFQSFLKAWGADCHKVSSSYNPHSNLRAETAVKTAKRIITDNTKSDGSPEWDRICRALLQHRNTPLDGIQFSPAQLLFGRPIRDFLPIRPGKFSPSEVWVDCAEKRELAMRRRLSLGGERWSEHTRALAPLKVGQQVFVQNQHGVGKSAKKWDRTGTIVEDKGYDKYSVRIDGSGRISDRNRRYLRFFKPDSPTMRRPKLEVPFNPTQVPVDDVRGDHHGQAQVPHIVDHADGRMDHQLQGVQEPDIATPMAPADGSLMPAPETNTPQAPAAPAAPSPRRSTRTRMPNVRYTMEEFDLSRD